MDEFLSWKAGFGLEKKVVKLRIKPKNASASLEAQDGSTLTAVQREALGSTTPLAQETKKETKPTPKPGSAGAFVFTGFRDKDLEARLVAAGWTQHDTIKKDTTLLIVADESKMGTTKVADAQKKGVRIILRADAQSLV